MARSEIIDRGQIMKALYVRIRHLDLTLQIMGRYRKVLSKVMV